MNAQFGNYLYFDEVSKKDLRIECVEHDGQMVAMKIDDQPIVLGKGILDRIYYDFQTPISVMGMQIHARSKSATNEKT